MQRTPLFLMANLGSEVTKIFYAKEKSDTLLLQAALRKAQHIISDIVQFPEMRARIPEMEILSSVISNISKPQKVSRISPQNLKAYFNPFAVRLMSSFHA